MNKKIILLTLAIVFLFGISVLDGYSQYQETNENDSKIYGEQYSNVNTSSNTSVIFSDLKYSTKDFQCDPLPEPDSELSIKTRVFCMFTDFSKAPPEVIDALNGTQVNWSGFITKATELHISKNFDDYFIFPELKVIKPVVIFGEASLPPPMKVYLHFKYDVDNGIDQIKARYDVDAHGVLKNEIIISEASPKKQNDSRIWSYWVDCKQGFFKVIKTSDDSFACVKDNTKQKLIEIGWATEFSSKYPPKQGCLAYNKIWNEDFRYCYAIDTDLCNDLGGKQTCAVDGSPGKTGLEDVCIRVCEFR